MEEKSKNWKILSRKLVYDGSPHIKISIDKVKLPNGKVIDDYHRIEIKDAVMLLVKNKNGELLTYKEYRHGINCESITFPAGGIEKGENSIDAAKRELLEETGYSANSFDIINDYIVSGSYMFSKLTFILVSDIEKIQDPVNKDIENPEIVWMNKEKVKLALKNKDFIGITYATGALHWILNEK
jgi:ADP-ribose pyrophosphatase